MTGTVEAPLPQGMRRDISVDYHQESGTWGVRMYHSGTQDFTSGQFVSWGAATPIACKDLPYYNYPLEVYDD